MVHEVDLVRVSLERDIDRVCSLGQPHVEFRAKAGVVEPERNRRRVVGVGRGDIIRRRKCLGADDRLVAPDFHPIDVRLVQPLEQEIRE
jgi:hypothetical protein